MQFKQIILFLILGLAFCTDAATRVTPINPAEAVFAPFWDSTLQEIKQWKTSSGKLSQDWLCVNYQWSRGDLKPGKPAFEMVRSDPFSCAGYDVLLITGRIPQGAKLQVELDTDQGKRNGEWIGTRPVRDEYAMPLNGAQKINRITLRIFDTGNNKVTAGTFLWMGLQNSRELALLLEQRKRFASQPLDVFLAPKGSVPAFKGRVNLLASPEALSSVQTAYQKHKKESGKDLLSENNLNNYNPEALLSDTLPFANEMLFGRVRDENRSFRDIRNLINKGIIAKNPQMLEKAARTALVFAMTQNWDSMFLSDFPDSGWDQRVFSHAYAAEGIALVLDYCWDLLSGAGRTLLEKRLALEGLGQINYNIWRYSYLFGNNQLSVFTRRRVASYLALEKAHGWNGSRIQPYTEMAMRELFDSIERLVHDDGSFMEGPPYFFYTLGSIKPVLEMYASARKKTLPEIIPARLKNLGNFADAFISTDRRGGMIPVSSGQGEGRHAAVGLYQFLALIAPESQWTTLYHDRYRRMGEAWLGDVSFMTRRAEVAPAPVKPKPLAVLPEMGVMASTRVFNGETVKLLLVGTKAATRCHRHNDRGSFVLEFAGDTYAADPGGQNYADVDGHMVKRSDYHNMLVPGTLPDNEPTMVATADVYPVGTGDQTRFHAEILPAPSSPDYFKTWKRVIDSPTPDQFTITDHYTLTPGGKSAKFLWITELPWKQLDASTIRIDGKNSYALIRFPKDLKFSSETFTVRQKEKFTRLIFEKNAPEGVIVMNVELKKR